MRIETGALQIDKDWTGLFIRGDDAFHLMNLLRKVSWHIAYCNKGTLNNSDIQFVANLCAIIDLDVNHNSEHRNPQYLNAEIIWKDRYEI